MLSGPWRLCDSVCQVRLPNSIWFAFEVDRGTRDETMGFEERFHTFGGLLNVRVLSARGHSGACRVIITLGHVHRIAHTAYPVCLRVNVNVTDR